MRGRHVNIFWSLSVCWLEGLASKCEGLTQTQKDMMTEANNIG
jgi:hypothetical protein